MKISIVTPSYNQGRFVEQAITSILEQGYSDFEHIIIDNCSTDETKSVVARYPHIQFYSEPDGGQSEALNKGFLLAKGDIIGWLNADDYYLPGAFHKIREAFESNHETDAIYSNVKFVNLNGNFIRNLKTHRPVRWMAFFYTFIQSTSFFFRKGIIKNHLIDQHLHYQMDMEYFARLLQSGYKLRYINDYFACFRWHESNKTNSTGAVRTKHLKESFYIINKLTGKNITRNRINEMLYLGIIQLVAKPVRRILVTARL